MLNESYLITRPAKDTSPEVNTTAGHRRPLPPDLLRQASRRLQIIALVGAGLWTLGTALGRLAPLNPDVPRLAQANVSDVIAAVSVTLSLGLFFYLRKGDRNPAAVINLGLAYMVVTALGVALLEHWGLAPADNRYISNVLPTISWIGPVILMFAAVVPAPPWQLFLAGLFAASMDPISMVLAQAAGLYQFGPLSNALLMHYPSYLLLGVAVVISHVVTRLGRQVAKERELGSYVLGELLGRGGMGEVYKATHRMLARPAAIKLIQPEMLARDQASAQLAVARFRREAEAAAKLRSPHTVELYDFGVTEDGTKLYFVMELLEGMDLESLVRREGPLPQQRVIHFLRQICESLEEAHVSGLVHRDIKPANIHVGRVGPRHDFVKVLDFGLVKSVAGEPSDDSMTTAAGTTPPGTPAYMAPEMALGEAVDGRADLYALGCVAYYLLTGMLVFEAETGFQMIAKHINEEPVPPSQRMREVALELDRVVLACLAKQPDDRPQSATDLDRMLAEIEIEPWSEAEATRWWRTHQPA